ncbi:MAG TPA: pantetheine-phosphate adenylyltransferase [Calditrichia bacterium]|nr:pantetheine-phosphate adenylyltransferase [Calditrichia bacterium]HQV31370.1 pantetheine-phosphate adenylyltransferase [Calditrichia bacterium]
MRIGIYPGTFDPITNGHLDIIERATKLFDRIIVTLARNSSKKPLFSGQERVDLVKEVIKQIDTKVEIEVEMFNGLIVDYAIAKKATAIIRGLRAMSDFEYEFQMALVNRRLSGNDGISTVFLMPHEKYTYLNSSIVRELASYGGDISYFVPPIVEKAILAKFGMK